MALRLHSYGLLTDDVNRSSLFFVIDVMETEHWLSSSRSSSASTSYVSVVSNTHVLIRRFVEEVVQFVQQRQLFPTALFLLFAQQSHHVLVDHNLVLLGVLVHRRRVVVADLAKRTQFHLHLPPRARRHLVFTGKGLQEGPHVFERGKSSLSLRTGCVRLGLGGSEEDTERSTSHPISYPTSLFCFLCFFWRVLVEFPELRVLRARESLERETNKTETGMLLRTFAVMERPIVCLFFHNWRTPRIRWAISGFSIFLRERFK